MSPAELESITRLRELPHWERLRDVAIRRLERFEGSISRVLFKSRSEVDPLEIEFYRGFRQGVFYVLDGLPNTAIDQLKKLADDNEKEVD